MRNMVLMARRALLDGCKGVDVGKVTGGVEQRVRVNRGGGGDGDEQTDEPKRNNNKTKKQKKIKGGHPPPCCTVRCTKYDMI